MEHEGMILITILAVKVSTLMNIGIEPQAFLPHTDKDNVVYSGL